jgi:hypothetical protein
VTVFQPDDTGGQAPRFPDGVVARTERLRQESLRNIRRLERLGVQSRLTLILFMAASAGAMFHGLVLPTFPHDLQAHLGPPPPLGLIHLGLILYGFSALVLTLARYTKGEGKLHGWSHLGFLLSFYFFYYYAGELEGSFWSVFSAGLTILVLENLRMANFCREELQKEKQKMAGLKDG